jgi:tellurite resistance protein TehA-like permease
MSGPVAGWREAIRTLTPGYFALIMATGIVSTGMDILGQDGLSVALMWLACVEYAVLVVLTAWRATAYRPELIADLRNPSRAFGAFTFIAATGVLGTRFVIAGYQVAALVLLVAGWIAWLCLGYVVPWMALLVNVRRPVLPEATGNWFIWTVASQSVAVLAAALEPSVDGGRRELALLAVFSWSVGLFLYAATGMLVIARFLLYPLRPEDITPPYWVAMGATAITVLAGAKIVQMADAPTVAATRGLAIGASVVFWAFGSWLIPALIAGGVWRHVVHRIPLRYEASMWSIVFPLGMYGVAGHYLGEADHLPIVRAIGADESWVALAALAITFVAMLRHLARTVFAVPRA